ncbi:methyltransferase [Cohnella sp. LGH]|nr:methyltransferase [Cohnella sp. LGH]
MIENLGGRLQEIREEERKYHEALYENQKLFAKGSWLAKPVRTVMEALESFAAYDYVRVLDLGCGVGRNSIPIAQFLQARSGEVVCVDLLVSALSKLEVTVENTESESRSEPCNPTSATMRSPQTNMTISSPYLPLNM